MSSREVRIVGGQVLDVRHPTAESLQGSDPVHIAPNYSATVLTLQTDRTGLEGTALVFTIGAGNEVEVMMVKSLLKLIEGMKLSDFTSDPGRLWKRMIDHHQARWMGDGIFRMAVGCIINALFDLWAKSRKMPLWKLLVTLEPEQIVAMIDWTYLRDALTPEEALKMLKRVRPLAGKRRKQLLKSGPKAYTTAGWTHLTDDVMAEKVRHAILVNKVDIVKCKVGHNLADDIRRLAIIRSIIGKRRALCLDSNQKFGVADGIAYMSELAKYKPLFWEEPTHPQDVTGYGAIDLGLARHRIALAGGEHCPNMIIAKQLMALGAIKYWQLDATRVGGVPEILATILLAKKFGIAVWPHAGGIGLCPMVLQLAIFNQIAVAGPNSGVVEYVDFLHDDLVFLEPVVVKNGRYVVPTAYGWGIDMQPSFIAAHTYPTGSAWVGKQHLGDITFKF